MLFFFLLLELLLFPSSSDVLVPERTDVLWPGLRQPCSTGTWLIHLLSQYLLSSYCVPVSLQGPGDSVLRMTKFTFEGP